MTCKQVLENGLRDANVVGWFWAINLAWSIGYCSWNGYAVPKDMDGKVILETFWGMPSWVFGGIFAPWIACTIFTAIYGLFLMRDDPSEVKG